ncbi:Dynamin-related protein 4C [Asimina triloba]
MARFGLDSSLTPEEDITQRQSITKTENGEASAAVPPLASSYDYYIRPLLDAVDRLRQMKVMEEGIGLPTIVVVGDQSSGKSSVLESLAGISLPRGQGICTRVPLVMRLQNIPAGHDQELLLQYEGGNSIPTTEEDIPDAITTATEAVAGRGKGISNKPLTLVVRKNGVPDLTMVDLPGITRVPVHGQPDNIYEQISNIIMEYIAPKESIILNVLSATVDFSTCESIRMSQQVDKTGERTLAVVTKADKAPEGLLEKVTADDVKIGLGYVCVRNRIGDETYQVARMQEAELFESHPLLSQIDRSIVGVPVLAQKLVQIQASSICKCLPEIVSKINAKLAKNVEELNKMPRKFTAVADAMQAFMRIVSGAKESLKKVLIRGEFEEYPDEKFMHCTARMREMLDNYAEKLISKDSNGGSASASDFLLPEISVLEETKGIGLPNFLPRSAFLTVLQRQVNTVADSPVEFVEEVMKYMEQVVLRVVSEHSKEYPQLLAVARRAVHKLMEKMRERSVAHVKELIEMEKMADYTANPEYDETWSRLMVNRKRLMGLVQEGYYEKTVSNVYGNTTERCTEMVV